MSADPTGFTEFPVPSPVPALGRAQTRYRLSWVVVGLWVSILLAGPVRGDNSESVDKRYDVVLFTGSGDHSPFWEMFTEFMEASADDLDIDLEVVYLDNDLRRMATEIRKVCRRPNKPSAIVVQAFKRSGQRSLEIVDQFQVPVFLVNAGLTRDQSAKLGAPRQRLKYWIGKMLPDDESAGFQLANALIDEARRIGRVGADGRVQVIGINGQVADFASVQREAGLRRAIQGRRDEAQLVQLISANWAKDQARKRSRILRRRHPHASVVWTASDHMAAGVVEAMHDLGLTPGKDVVIGGVDATREGTQMVEQGTLHATIGGHFMEGGWVTVMLHDYFEGIDLGRIPTESASPMTLVTQANLAEYQFVVDPATWQRFDFGKLSLVRNPERKDYQFGVRILAPSDTAKSEPSESHDVSSPLHQPGTSE